MTGHAAVHPDVIRDLFVAFSQLAHAHPVAILLPFVMFFFFKVIARPHADRPVSYFRPADLDSWPRHHELPPPLPPRPESDDGDPHPDYCPCVRCRAWHAEIEALCGPPASSGPPAVMPEPSDDLGDDSAPCAHADGVARVMVAGELVRYTCGAPWCDANWPPGTEFPAGTVMLPDDDRMGWG